MTPLRFAGRIVHIRRDRDPAIEISYADGLICVPLPDGATVGADVIVSVEDTARATARDRVIEAARAQLKACEYARAIEATAHPAAQIEAALVAENKAIAATNDAVAALNND